MRNRFAAKKATPAVVPSWMLSQSNMASILSDYLTQMTAWIAKPDPLYQVFRVPGSSAGSKTGQENGTNYVAGAFTDIWQPEMQVLVLGWMVENGEDDWQAAHKFIPKARLRGPTARAVG